MSVTINGTTGISSESVIYGVDGVGAVSRTLAYKLGDNVSVKDFGAVGDGVTDDTAAIQAAIDACVALGQDLYFPAGNYRTTSALTTAKGLRFIGTRPIAKGPSGADAFKGSWLYFDHTGKGIDGTNSLGAGTTGLCLEDIGTRRNQPTPAPGWVPNDHDFDVYTFGFLDVTLRNVMMLNPTRGVAMFGSPTDTTGRLEVYNLKMQPFKVGIQIDVAYDVCRIDQLHVWPFWRDDINVHTYCMLNLDAIWMFRNDNPMLSNIFTIFARSGVRFSQGTYGQTSKVHLVNADFDRGVFGLWVDSTVTSGVTGQITNMTHQGETGVIGSKAIWVQGNNSNIDVSNFRTDLCSQNGVRIEGTGNLFRFTHASVLNFDQLAANFTAFEALNGNRIEFTNKPLVGNSGGSGGAYSPTGIIVSDDWRAFTPAFSSQTGVITAWTSSGIYKVVGNTVHVEVSVDITTNGTGGGAVQFNLPFGTPLRSSMGSGRETAIAGKGLTVSVPATAPQASIFNYDNSYPGVDGANLVVNLSYSISL